MKSSDRQFTVDVIITAVFFCVALAFMLILGMALPGCGGGEQIEKTDKLYNASHGAAQPATPTQARAAQWPNETDREWRLRTGYTRIRSINEEAEYESDDSE